MGKLEYCAAWANSAKPWQVTDPADEPWGDGSGLRFHQASGLHWYSVTSDDGASVYLGGLFRTHGGKGGARTMLATMASELPPSVVRMDGDSFANVTAMWAHLGAKVSTSTPIDVTMLPDGLTAADTGPTYDTWAIPLTKREEQ